MFSNCKCPCLCGARDTGVSEGPGLKELETTIIAT
jgi:chromosome segregation ATPase